MRLLKRILSYPSRLRRSRGFGVHSPFAYNFITKVLREKEAQYYAYAEIAAFCPRARKASFNEIFAGQDISIPEAHQLFRILVHFNSQHIMEVGHGHEVTNIILGRAVPHAKVYFWDHARTPQIPPGDDIEPLMLINQIPNQAFDDLAEDIFNHMRRRDCIIVVRNLYHIKSSRRMWERLLEFKDFGMAFSDGYMGVFVARRSLPSQYYEITT